MPENVPEAGIKSAERLAFEFYLRTGRRLIGAAPTERKFNPYHDPRNGQFTFAPGGPRSLADAVFSDRQGIWKPRGKPTARDAFISPQGDSPSSAPEVSVGSPSSAAHSPVTLQMARGARNPRARMGGNGGPPLDPLVIEQVFPNLRKAAAGSIVASVDDFLDLTGPARAVSADLHHAEVVKLIRQIQTVDPGYRFESLGQPRTLEGMANEIRKLRLDRALVHYRVRDEIRPLQVQVARIMQERADSAYADAVARYEAGQLAPRLSREEAIGNYIDGTVRADLRSVFSVHRVDTSRGRPVRVVGREYDTSGNDRTYRIPDARVGNIAFDVTLSRKTLATAQVRGFFNADFKPDVVVIIRPTQLGAGNTYAIKKPR